MKITVVRSGGFAGLSRRWVVIIDQQEDPAAWISLIDELPWGARPVTAPQPDRFVYSIRVSRRRIMLAEQELSGPWRELIERVKDAAGSSEP